MITLAQRLSLNLQLQISMQGCFPGGEHLVVLFLCASQGVLADAYGFGFPVVGGLASQLLLCVRFLQLFTRLIRTVVITDFFFYRLSPNQLYPPLVLNAVKK